MYDGIGQAFGALWRLALFSVFVLLPLALWKVIDIVVWLCHHLSFSRN